jgi:hypothetical protein
VLLLLTCFCHFVRSHRGGPPVFLFPLRVPPSTVWTTPIPVGTKLYTGEVRTLWISVTPCSLCWREVTSVTPFHYQGHCNHWKNNYNSINSAISASAGCKVLN